MAALAPAPRRDAAFAAAAVCFFVSGVAALLYEVAWMRHLGALFGNTVHAVTTVLAVYMGGLALGSRLAARWADGLRRPLRTYAILEALVALWSAATPLLFRAAEAAYLALRPGPSLAAAVHFTLAALVLLPPTVLLGATLPVLSSAVGRGAQAPAARVGLLYALNTWGAVAGTVAAGFLLLPSIGLSKTVWLGVALDLLVAALALSIGEPGGLPQPAAPGAVQPRPFAVRVALIAIGLSGAASMAYEIAWTRALSLAVGSSTYAFSAMLATFLAGLAGGALLVARWLRTRPAGLLAFAIVEAAIAFLALVLLPAFGKLPDAYLFVVARAGVTASGALTAQLALSALVMIGPTLLIGASLPLVIAALAQDRERLGADVGTAYAANTAGTIAGSLVAGFWAISALGIESTVAAAAACNLGAGIAVGIAAAPGRALRFLVPAVAPFALLAAVLPRWDPAAMTAGAAVYADKLLDRGLSAARERRELLFYREGLSTTVAVVRTPTATLLTVNGKADGSDGRDMATQLLLGHLGALLHPAPQRAFVVGLGTGVTAGALAQHPLQRIDVAEIEPAVIDAARHFARQNRGALDDARVRVLIGDGRQLLAASRERYDLVVSEPSNPWIAGVAGLFTREFYLTVRERLAPGGVVVQWLQAYSIFGHDMQMVARTFAEVFPHVSMWRGSLGDVLLVATPQEAALDGSIVGARLGRSAALRDDFARFGWDGGQLAFRFLLDDAAVRRFGAGARVNTDDLPLLEFSAPLALYGAFDDQNRALIRSFRGAPRPRPAREALAAAESLWREGLYPEADAELAGLDGVGSDGLRAQHARVLLSLGRVDAAAVAGDEDVARAALALSHPALRDRVRRAVRPGNTEASALGELLVDAARGDPAVLRLALLHLDAALLRAPGNVALLNNRGIALALLGDAQAAERAFRRAVEVQPRFARSYFNLGALAERQGQLAQAAGHYGDALRLDPSLEQARVRLSALEQAR